MKPISAILGSPNEKVEEKFAWWPIKSSFSKKTIWLKRYVQVEVYWDDAFNHPLRSNTWTLIYSRNEYLMYLLRKDREKQIY